MEGDYCGVVEGDPKCLLDVGWVEEETGGPTCGSEVEGEAGKGKDRGQTRGLD